ncbi:MAG: hypothetical protein WC175_04780 [Candidatus Dojkabacteria bacterium]
MKVKILNENWIPIINRRGPIVIPIEVNEPTYRTLRGMGFTVVRINTPPVEEVVEEPVEEVVEEPVEEVVEEPVEEVVEEPDWIEVVEEPVEEVVEEPVEEVVEEPVEEVVEEPVEEVVEEPDWIEIVEEPVEEIVEEPVEEVEEEVYRVALSNLTKQELKGYLTKAGVEFQSNDKKSELVELMIENEIMIDESDNF